MELVQPGHPRTELPLHTQTGWHRQLNQYCTFSEVHIFMGLGNLKRRLGFEISIKKNNEKILRKISIFVKGN